MSLPYCGAAPDPAELLARWNLDPLLMLVLAVAAVAHLRTVPADRRRTGAAGWGVTALALLSPLCALSVSLFSARVGQHMVLALAAAPLIALAWPRRSTAPGWQLWSSAALFAAALWGWHLPGPYALTFRSDVAYWAMHLSLWGSAVLLWRDLLHHDAERLLAVVGAGLFTTVQMGLLGAVLTFAARPLYPVHFGTVGAWGLEPLGDQSLGGLLMWVPGTLFFLVAAIRSMGSVLPQPQRA